MGGRSRQSEEGNSSCVPAVAAAAARSRDTILSSLLLAPLLPPPPPPATVSELVERGKQKARASARKRSQGSSERTDRTRSSTSGLGLEGSPGPEKKEEKGRSLELQRAACLLTWSSPCTCANTQYTTTHYVYLWMTGD